MGSEIQRQLNDLGSCCDEWVKVKVTRSYLVTKEEEVCVPTTFLASPQQRATEIDSKLKRINIPPDLTGEIEVVKTNWNYL